jgi:hypothetical protein
MKGRAFALLVLGALLLAPACATTRGHPGPPAPHGTADSAWDEGYKRGLMAGGWAGYRDLGKPYRKSFWRDAQYSRASEGYRPEYGSKAAYAEAFRIGYEKGYRERRERERGQRRRTEGKDAPQAFNSP